MPRRRSSRQCDFAGCGRPHSGKGLCETHRIQFKRGGELKPIRPMRPKGTGGIDARGYMRTTTIQDGLRVVRKEHRVVMEGILGRPLVAGENVHHKNGDKLDNRPENLELWISFQPPGQRVEDLVEWAREILRRYG